MRKGRRRLAPSRGGLKRPRRRAPERFPTRPSLPSAHDLKKAAIDDGKDLNDHPNVDVHEHGSRLLKAIETLDAAGRDVKGEEDNPIARDLKHRSFEHIKIAREAARRAHAQWLRDMGK